MNGERLAKFQDHVIAVVMSNQDRPWFSICIITDACKMLGITDYYRQPAYQLLNKLHCEDYKGMTPELVSSIKQMIREVLTPRPPKIVALWRWLGSLFVAPKKPEVAQQ